MSHTEADIAAANAYADLPNETFTRQLETLGHLCNLELGFLAGIEHEREKSQMAAANARLDQEWPIQQKYLEAAKQMLHQAETIQALQAKLEVYRKFIEHVSDAYPSGLASSGFMNTVGDKARAALVEASGAEGGK